MDVRFERLMASDITKRISESISERSILPIEVLLSCGRMTESRLMPRALDPRAAFMKHKRRERRQGKKQKFYRIKENST